MASADESSELSSAPSAKALDTQASKDGILKFFSKRPASSVCKKIESTPPRKRDPSPRHEYVLADNPDIPFIVMFRSRYSEAFPKSVPTFGPQELERDIVDVVPGALVEIFLCALLGLLLNRKQDVKAGHYNRALEDAINSHKSQWPRVWEKKSPLSGGTTFVSMVPTQRLTLLRNLILWSLSSSEAVRGMLTASYKQNRHDDDLNQPLSIHPWGLDGERRRYWLIEGQDDTHFRVYRESSHTSIKRTWWSVASDIDELRSLSDKLVRQDGSQKARTFSTRINTALPRFEATEEKRKRKEYRQARRQQFKRVEPVFPGYEGRTRGKRMKYTFSDDEDEGYPYSDTASRRSTRNTGSHTPAEDLTPTVTLSGRQVRPRNGGAYGESLHRGAPTPAVTTGYDGAEDEDGVSTGRPRRDARNSHATRGGKHIQGHNPVDEMDDGDATEQDYGDDEEDDDHVPSESEDDDPDVTDDDVDMEDDFGKPKKRLIVKLPLKVPSLDGNNSLSPDRKITIKLNVSPKKDQAKNQQGQNPQILSTSSATNEDSELATCSKDSATLTHSIIINGASEEPSIPATPSVLVSDRLESAAPMSSSIEMEIAGA